MMITASLPHGLPDPQRDAAFYARVPTKRALAWVADVVLILAASLLIVPFTAFTAMFFFPILMMAVGFAYRWWTLTAGSATWRMRLMRIELRDHCGDRLNSVTALFHTLGYTVSVVTFPLQLISAAMMATTPRGQGISDFVLGTTAINRPACRPDCHRKSTIVSIRRFGGLARRRVTHHCL